MKVKIIKFKEFEAKGVKATHYTVAYRGRVFGVNTLRFADMEGSITVEKDVLTFHCDVEVIKRIDTDQLTGEVRTFIDIVPASGLKLADF